MREKNVLILNYHWMGWCYGEGHVPLGGFQYQDSVCLHWPTRWYHTLGCLHSADQLQ